VLLAFLRARSNDLESAAIQIAPEIAAVLAALREQPRCDLARMSGSGGTCFGLFASSQAATAAADAVTGAHPGWWVRATAFG
jgi:4-diphosphocytidyl-2-C-methyl-D-erythritol kinase